ncbi:hypothetical protein T484DRAFT_1741498 [Baffinella frigidus]|nr:hypothetical protein T484DRAFT_1741498 [Cryptophyta sp. CCMP2293]
MNCLTVEDCDHHLSCIADVRLIDASSSSTISSSTMTAIAECETSLMLMRAKYMDRIADQHAQDVLARQADRRWSVPQDGESTFVMLFGSFPRIVQQNAMPLPLLLSTQQEDQERKDQERLLATRMYLRCRTHSADLQGPGRDEFLACVLSDDWRSSLGLALHERFLERAHGGGGVDVEV